MGPSRLRSRVLVRPARAGGLDARRGLSEDLLRQQSMAGSISEGPLHPDLPLARSVLIVRIEPQTEAWTARGPDPAAPARTVPSPLEDPTFAGLLRELWEWT